MANFDTGNLVVAQTLLNKKWGAPEMRIKPFPALALLTRNSDLLLEGAELLRTREDRAIEAHYLTRTKRATAAARTHNHTGTIDDSGKFTLTWTTKKDDTAISIKLLDKNVHSFNEVLANKLEQCCINILEDKETEAIAYLRAQRATTQPTLKGATFNAATDAVEIAANMENRFFQTMKSVMRQNYLTSQVDVIADSLKGPAAEFLMNQGTANYNNLGFQFSNMQIAESPELTDANYDAGIVLAFPTGTVGALHWIPKQNREGRGDYNTVLGGYGTFNFMGYNFALHGYAERANTEANNGNSQDDLLQFELSLDTSYNKAPLNYVTNRTDSVILQFGQVA